MHYSLLVSFLRSKVSLMIYSHSYSFVMLFPSTLTSSSTTVHHSKNDLSKLIDAMMKVYKKENA